MKTRFLTRLVALLAAVSVPATLARASTSILGFGPGRGAADDTPVVLLVTLLAAVAIIRVAERRRREGQCGSPETLRFRP